MAEIKGIDVSRWNGNIDWKTVASYGMGFAILRITEKGNIVDSTFEPNYKGCIENKIPVGVYKYSYATTIAQIKKSHSKLLQSWILNYQLEECILKLFSNVQCTCINLSSCFSNYCISTVY